MRKNFPKCLLVQDGSKDPELVISEGNLHPGSGLSPDQGKPVLLAGGFPSVVPESGFPLSSTLQLNHDLATLSAGELAEIARAELRRFNKVNYRRYTVEADNRVCLIGDNAGRLITFLDTYGGVLEITPLLVKGHHPEIPTVTELGLTRHEQGYRLEYQVRSPVNFELCGYCGACGPVCPEQCISERLFVDYHLCTFCGECQKACGAGAIDVHGALNKVLEVPAIIILGTCGVELPTGGKANVFHEDQLAEYFSTLFSCRIDEVVTWNGGLCQFSARLGRGCDLCLSSCSRGAIVQDSRGVTVDARTCEECGACVAACPTGALQNERFNDAAFVDYFRAVTVPPEGTVIIGGQEELHALWWRQQGTRRENILFLQYDTIASLTLFHLMFLLNRGAGRIVVLENGSRDRSVPPLSHAVAQEQLELANALMFRLFGQDNAVVSCGLRDFDTLMAVPPVGGFGGAWRQEPFVHRRQSLAEILFTLVEKSGRRVTMRPDGYSPFATVSCNRDRCTQCMACLNDCRIGALSADPRRFTLNHLGALCVGCGLCVETCPEEALTIGPDFTLDDDFFMSAELARAEPMACRQCGKIFGTRKSFERVMAILSQRETVDIDHFAYCGTCRVVKMFAAE